jgi:hypothetical protein
VDYALISLRIALEKTKLPELSKLSLSIHPSALLYFRPMLGIGPSPAGTRWWRQIRELELTIDSWDFNIPNPRLDLFKIIRDFIRFLSPNLVGVSFTWNGRPGPCPFTLYSTSPFTPTVGECLLLAATTKMDLVFPQLRYMQVRNCCMTKAEVLNRIYMSLKNAEKCHFDFHRSFRVHNDGLSRQNVFWTVNQVKKLLLKADRSFRVHSESRHNVFWTVSKAHEPYIDPPPKTVLEGIPESDFHILPAVPYTPAKCNSPTDLRYQHIKAEHTALGVYAEQSSRITKGQPILRSSSGRMTENTSVVPLLFVKSC